MDNGQNEDFAERKISLDLHAHTSNKYNMSAVFDAMEIRHLDMLGIMGINKTIFHKILNNTKTELSSSIIYDRAGLVLLKGTYETEKYIMNAGEYEATLGSSKIHILVVGHSWDAETRQTAEDVIKRGLDNNALVIIAHPFTDTEKTSTAGHITKDLENEIVELCNKFNKKIALEWNGYCNPFIKGFIRYGFGWLAPEHLYGYHDVNKKAEEFHEQLFFAGYNIPLIAGTDMHAREKRHLMLMGTARTHCLINGIMPAEVLESAKKYLFEENNSTGCIECEKKTVSVSEIMDTYGIPLLRSKILRKYSNEPEKHLGH